MAPKSAKFMETIAVIEASIAKMERELKDAEGPRKVELQELIRDGYQALKRFKRQVLH
jgi:hypothetical protein